MSRLEENKQTREKLRTVINGTEAERILLEDISVSLATIADALDGVNDDRINDLISRTIERYGTHG